MRACGRISPPIWVSRRSSSIRSRPDSSRDILVPEDAWSPMHVAWERSDTGFLLRGQGWVKNPWRDGFKHAPISDSAKKALVDMELFRTPPRRADWEAWLDTMTYQQFLTDVVGIDSDDLPEVLKYLNPMTVRDGLRSRRGCHLSLFRLQLPAAGRDRLLPLRERRCRSDRRDLPGELSRRTCGHGPSFPEEDYSGGAQGEYRMADILNSPVQWDQLDKPNEPVRMRLSSTVVAVQHEGARRIGQGRDRDVCRAAASSTRCARRRRSCAASSTRTATSAAISRPNIARR